jgi:hypothetical protein
LRDTAISREEQERWAVVVVAVVVVVDGANALAREVVATRTNRVEMAHAGSFIVTTYCFGSLCLLILLIGDMQRTQVADVGRMWMLMGGGRILCDFEREREMAQGSMSS